MATGLTFLSSSPIFPAAVSTSALVFAASTASLALSAAAFAASLALVFSSGVKSGRASIALFLAANASSIAFLASSFLAITGLSVLILSVPAFSTLSNSGLVVAVELAISSRALALSAFTCSIALSFSSLVASGLLLIASICFSAALLTSLIAGCLSRVTNSDNGFLSVEPSVYVTTRFPWSSFVTEAILVLASSASTVLPFLSAKLASSLFLLCSSCNFSLILANSASVTLAGSVTATFSVGALISYLSV